MIANHKYRYLMSGSLNKAIIIGNLGRDPEIRSTASGDKEIAVLNIATSEQWKDRATGERKEKTEWHRVVVFNEGLARLAKNYLKKGSKVYLEGSLQTRKWEDNSGQEKYITEIVLQNFGSSLIMLDNKSGGGSIGSERNKEGDQVGDFDHSELDDEIPF